MTVFAMVFPGQGSQTVGMLAELSLEFSVVKETFTEASSILGYDLWQLVQQGPPEELNKTSLTQPALLTSSVAIWRIWRQHCALIPAFFAGHSLGEYSALVCAGSLDFASAIKLVALRGKFMQENMPVGTGAMAVIIGLEINVITDVCKYSAQDQIVSLVNFNSPGQVVISGHKEAVERAVLACKEAGAKRSFLLPVSVPAHCVLMRPAAEKLAKELELVTFTAPQVPVINNINVRVEHDPTAIRQALVRQLYSPVRWIETIEYLAAQGVEMLLEVGPGKVLTGLTKRIVSTLSSAAVNDPISLVTQQLNMERRATRR